MGGWDIDVLYATDDESVAERLAADRDRWTVETAEAVESVKSKHAPTAFDCVVTNYDLPGGDGIELVEWVRGVDPDLPVILHVADGSEEVASEAISAGVSDYLRAQEPVSDAKLLETRIENAVEQYRLQQELTESRRRLSLFVEQSPLGVIEWNRDGEAVRVNAAAQEILGYDESELLGEHWENVIAESDVPAFREQLAGLDDDGTGFRHLNENVTGDGEHIVCEWHNQVVTDDDGSIVGSYSQFQEVTDRQFRREAVADLHDIVDELAACESRQAVFEQTVDAAGRILKFDRAAVAIEADGLLEVRAMSNELSLDEHPTLPASQGIAGKTYQRGESVLVDDVVDNEEAEPQSGDMRSAISVPLGEIGVFQAVETVPGAFAQQDLELAKLLVQHAETALERLAREREVERIYEQVEFALEATDSMIWAADMEAGEVRAHLGPVERLLGLPGDEFVDVETVLTEGLHPEDIERVRSEAQKVVDGKNEEFSAVVRTAPEHGQARWLEALGYLQDDDYMVGLAMDVTERERRERELREQNERLEQFTNVVSHDLRNPLQVAESWLEIARDEFDSEYLDNIAQAHDRMSVLLEQLLALARDDDRAHDTESVALGVCSEQCWRNVETENATLVADVTETLSAERSRLQQLLENLFRNAVEHGPEDVVVTVGRLDDGFYVADDGPGIPADERESVFETGYSSDSQGTGFGLSIVDDVAAAHGWEVSVADSEAGGARFEITGVEFETDAE